jgi:hypothetical protein
MKIGDATISEKHSNFFVNQGSATSNDMENLISLVREKVLNTTGIKLELELQIIGEKNEKNNSSSNGRNFGRKEISILSGRACARALKKRNIKLKF